MAELGKIEKPALESFDGKKKLYCIRNLYILQDSPEEYKKLFHRYWDEVSLQIEKIEAGEKIKKVFCENIFDSDKQTLDSLVKINERAVQIIKSNLDKGGTLLALDKKEIFGPFMDWSNCLMVTRTHEVFNKIQEFYTDSLNTRIDHILDIIEKNLSAGEAGLLIMRDEDRAKIQFPADIEVFLITPPSLDDLLKWLRGQILDRNKETDSKE